MGISCFVRETVVGQGGLSSHDHFIKHPAALSQTVMRTVLFLLKIVAVVKKSKADFS